MLIIILLPATLVMVLWLVLQGMTAQEDWVAAAYKSTGGEMTTKTVY